MRRSFAFQRGRSHRDRVVTVRSDHILDGGVTQLPEFEVAQIPNIAPVRVKVPLRLQGKLLTVTTPIVGLEFIDEYLPESSSDVEPYYEVRNL